MKGLSFVQQVVMGTIMMVFAYILAYRSGAGVIIIICWAIFGLLFVINPVAPHTLELWFKEHTRAFMRVLGVALILGGLLSTAELKLG